MTESKITFFTFELNDKKKKKECSKNTKIWKKKEYQR